MVVVRDEYAKGRNFAKKFMSYFVIKPTAVKLGYVAFAKDVVLTRADGKQACANELAAKGTRFTFGQDAAVEYDECASPFPLAVESDLENVLADDSTKAARQIDMKYFKGGTKMFLGKEQVDGMEGMEGMEGVVEVIEVVGMEKLERTKDAAKTETEDLAQVLEEETILAETTVAAEFIEAVSLVEHRLAKLDNDDLRFRLRALRLQSNIGGWMRYERKKASARRSKRRKGRKKGSSHRTRGTGGNGNDTCSASVEEMEQIVNSVDTGVIDEWKKLGDMSVNTAKEVYVNTARKEL